jgi:hypothetical protein
VERSRPFAYGSLAAFLLAGGAAIGWFAGQASTPSEKNAAAGAAQRSPAAPSRMSAPEEAGRRSAQLLKKLETAREAEAAAEFEPLRPGQTRRMTMDFRGNPSHQFVIDVPDDAVAMLVELKGAPCIFDIFGRTLAPMSDPYSEYEHYNEAQENRLRITRHEGWPLETGVYYLAVEYPSLYPPTLGNRMLASADYEITVSFITIRIDGELKPGTPLAGRLSPETGSFCTFVVDVPEGAEALRLDLDNTHSDLELLARHEAQILHPEDADHAAAGAVGREILVIDRDSDPPLSAGRWYVNVIESLAADDAEFTLHATLGADPPSSLLAFGSPPPVTDDRTRALYATVSLTTGTSGGSGVVISPAGLILTNYHVVAEALVAAEAKIPKRQKPGDSTAAAPGRDDVIVAITLDPRYPPVEMFRGEVLEHDEKTDLALVRVTRGYYGQPLPADYRFPHVALGEPETLEIGDPLNVCGFPTVGDLRNRPAITLTRGIVSGYSGPQSIKTDALISGGNSGGGAFDEHWRLVGCPTFTVTGYEGDYAQLGYIVSTRAIPTTWLELLK